MQKKSLFIFVVFLITFTSGKTQFIKEYFKSATSDTRFHAIVPVSNDLNSNLYIAGNYGEQLIIAEVKQNGNMVWSKRVIVNNDNYMINTMFRDSDGNLVFNGSVFTGVDDNANAFAIKFDPIAKIMLWQQKSTVNAHFYYGTESGPGGNYVFCGQEEGVGTGNQADDIVMMADRNTGVLTLISNLNQHVNETANAVVSNTVTGDLYVTGRYELNVGASKFRICLTKMDQLGNVDWTKYYLKSLGSTARFYSEDIVLEDDGIVIVGCGDNAGTNIWKNMYAMKTDLDGNLEWAKKYDLTLTSTDGLFSSIKKYDDGYIFFGVLHNLVDGDIMMVNVDLSGNLVWAKTFPFRKKPGTFGLYAPSSTVVIGTNIFSVGERLQDDGSIRGVMLKAPVATGDIGICDVDLTMEVESVDTFDDSFILENASASLSFTSTTPLVKNHTFNAFTYCSANAFTYDDYNEKDAFENLSVNEYSGFKFYPNPVSENLIIQTEDENGAASYNALIYDIIGNVVMEVNQISVVETIDISTLTNGIYVIKIYDDLHFELLTHTMIKE